MYCWFTVALILCDDVHEGFWGWCSCLITVELGLVLLVLITCWIGTCIACFDHSMHWSTCGSVLAAFLLWPYWCCLTHVALLMLPYSVSYWGPYLALSVSKCWLFVGLMWLTVFEQLWYWLVCIQLTSPPLSFTGSRSGSQAPSHWLLVVHQWCLQAKWQLLTSFDWILVVYYLKLVVCIWLVEVCDDMLDLTLKVCKLAGSSQWLGVSSRQVKIGVCGFCFGSGIWLEPLVCKLCICNVW